MSNLNNTQQLNLEFEKNLKEFREHKTNLMVVGGTGVGKSSLINKVFDQNIAIVGSGQPVTRGCQKFEHPTMPITIFDSEGYEIVDGNLDNSNFEQVVIREIQNRRGQELKNHIHLFWYCISISSKRITSYDIDNIKKLNQLSSNLAIVLTQCDNDELDDNNQGKIANAFKKELKKAGIHNDVFEVMIVPDEKDFLELNNLIEWSSKTLPDDKLRVAFIASQRMNLPLKEKEAFKIINITAGMAATAAGANPFPMSDAAIIAPIQIGLATKLANIYGFSLLSSSVTALLQQQLVSLIGKQLATSLTKLIPVAGSIINAGVAGALTYGTGYALNSLYYSAYEHLLETGKEPDFVNLFKNLDLSGFNFNEMLAKFKENNKA